MTIKDWIYLGLTIVGYLLAIIAGIYTKNKDKINKATAAGKAMDVVGQLATYAVHEAEHTDLENDQKRKFASQVIEQGLSYLGIKDVTANVINGAIEKAVNAMHLANLDDPAISENVDEKNVLQPVDQLKLENQSTSPSGVDMNKGDDVNGK